jgi:hypothetical protein
MNQSSTPRTDAHIKEVEAMGLYKNMDVVTPDFARALELEVASLNLKLGKPTDEENLNGSAYAQIKWWKDIGDDDQDLRRKLERENARLREALKRRHAEQAYAMPDYVKAALPNTPAHLRDL